MFVECNHLGMYSISLFDSRDWLLLKLCGPQSNYQKKQLRNDISCYHFIPVFPNFWAVSECVCVIIYDWHRNRFSLYARNIIWCVILTKFLGACILSTRVCASVLMFLIINHWKKFGHSWELRKVNWKLLSDYFNACTLQLLLFCTMTNQCTINLQTIILLLHVSTLLCHSQGARNVYLAKLHKYVNAVVGISWFYILC
jgi:hypothetical protein